LSSGFMTYARDIPLACSPRARAHLSTFVLLPSLDRDVCVTETVGRQIGRPSGRSSVEGEAVVRARFRSMWPCRCARSRLWVQLPRLPARSSRRWRSTRFDGSSTISSSDSAFGQRSPAAVFRLRLKHAPHATLPVCLAASGRHTVRSRRDRTPTVSQGDRCSPTEFGTRPRRPEQLQLVATQPHVHLEAARVTILMVGAALGLAKRPREEQARHVVVRFLTTRILFEICAWSTA
jgi:hypothetical protein